MSSIGLMGKKIGMTQIFNDMGQAIPVTLLYIGPCTITNIINNELKTYSKIQIGYEYINPQKLTKSEIGYFHKIKLPCFKYLIEYQNSEQNKLTIGQILSIKNLTIGNYINVSGLSIGKGFSGYQKRHHFSRGPMSHGSKNHRQPGSIGAGTTPGRVFPGKKMSGRMGGNKVTIKNLKIIDIRIQENIIILKGSVPGKIGNLLYLYNK
uniref:Large ribosomal subunit protein uL3c n=1 Tax=Halydictyon mirabile TaxID=189652 RepID=A0A4D6WUP7_9FLOR|nr:ribosomal protein L3 [Halydictyon mirabile]